MHGCNPGNPADTWDEPADANYDRIRDKILTANGLSEQQVQVVWCMMIVGRSSRTTLPAPEADAFLLKKGMGNIVRTLKIRYPNLQQAFLTSQIYCGYCTKPQMFPVEPISYEGAFGMKWVIEAQIKQMKDGMVDGLAGDLNCEKGVAPWIAWGPYLWADGVNARSDGLAWPQEEFESDGTHVNDAGIQKSGRLMLDFFKSDPRTKPWFTITSR